MDHHTAAMTPATARPWATPSAGAAYTTPGPSATPGAAYLSPWSAGGGQTPPSASSPPPGAMAGHSGVASEAEVFLAKYKRAKKLLQVGVTSIFRSYPVLPPLVSPLPPFHSRPSSRRMRASDASCQPRPSGRPSSRPGWGLWGAPPRLVGCWSILRFG